MGKNLTGGGKTKGQARKRANPTNGNTNMILRMPDNEYEIFACVTKMFGNGRISVVDNINKEYVGIIRGKMKGRSKRHNIITVGTIVLVGLRDWESPNFIHVDVLEIYDNSQTNQIHKIPNSNITNLISIRDNLYNLNPTLKNSHTNNNDDGILFDENHIDDDENENKMVFGSGNQNKGEDDNDVPAQKLPLQDFNMIDFDDI